MSKFIGNNNLRRLFIFILLIILFACERYSSKIPEDCYTIEYVENKNEDGYLTIPSYTNYIGLTKYSNEPEYITKYVKDKEFRLYKNSQIEIQHIFEIKFDINQTEIYNFFVSVNNKNKAFYIIWKGNDTLKYDNCLDIQLNINADTVYSNISNKNFKIIFPNFRGLVVDGKVKNISVKHNYPIFNHLFYLDISFPGFKLGNYEYWWKNIDTYLSYNRYWDSVKQIKLDSISNIMYQEYLNDKFKTKH